MNKDLLERVAAHIETHPEKYDQNFWCGTVHCIAGTAFALIGNDVEKYELGDSEEIPTINNHVAQVAMKALELSEDQANRLFLGAQDECPMMWFTNYDLEDHEVSNEDRANAAANRIRHFIATEGRE